VAGVLVVVFAIVGGDGAAWWCLFVIDCDAWWLLLLVFCLIAFTFMDG